MEDAHGGVGGAEGMKSEGMLATVDFERVSCQHRIFLFQMEFIPVLRHIESFAVSHQQPLPKTGKSVDPTVHILEKYFSH